MDNKNENVRKAQEIGKKIFSMLPLKVKIIIIAVVGLLFILLMVIFLVVLGSQASASSNVSTSGGGITKIRQYLTQGYVTVVGTEDYPTSGTYSVEDYVYGVIYAKVKDYSYPDEYIKLLAVLAWTYAVDISNQESVENSEATMPFIECPSAVSFMVAAEASFYMKIGDVAVSVSNQNFDYASALDQVNNGSKYQDVLKNIYGDDMEFIPISSIDEGGLVEDIETGFFMRMLRPSRNNIVYYMQDDNNYAYTGYEGECSWYAGFRAREILQSLGSSIVWNSMPNGGNYCDSHDAEKFNTSTDYNKPKQGAIVSWKNSGYGHVAVVESVDEENGTVTYSEAGMSNSACGSGNYGTDKEKRKKCCEDNGSGCFKLRENIAISEMSTTRSGTGKFACYIYLTEPK